MKRKKGYEYRLIESVYSFPADLRFVNFISDATLQLDSVYIGQTIKNGIFSLNKALELYGQINSYIKLKEIDGNQYMEVHQLQLIKLLVDEDGNIFDKIMIFVVDFDRESIKLIGRYFGKMEVERIAEHISMQTHVAFKMLKDSVKLGQIPTDVSSRDPMSYKRILLHISEDSGKNKYEVEIGINHDGDYAGVFMRTKQDYQLAAAIIRTNELNAKYVDKSFYVQNEYLCFKSFCVCRKEVEKLQKGVTDGIAVCYNEMVNFVDGLEL